MYVQKWFNPAVSSKTIWNAHPTLQKAIDYVPRLKENSYLLKELKMELDMVMLIDAAIGNDPKRQQKLENITCIKCSQKGHYRKDCSNSACTSPVPDQTSTIQTYCLPTMVSQTVTASYALLQNSLVTIHKELARVKKRNHQLRKTIQNTQSRKNSAPQPSAT